MMNEIKIPTRFMLMGHWITVWWDDELCHKDDALGHAVYRDDKVVLQAPTSSKPLNQEMIEHVFLHELTHMILNTLGNYELRDDEQFVDSFSGLLHQALKTAEY